MTTRTVSATCPICKEKVEVEVEVQLIENATLYPVSVVMQHGKPSHFMIFYIDAQFRVRGVDGHKVVVTKDIDQNPVDLALEDLRERRKFIEIPTLLNDLKIIHGVELADSKGAAIVSLSEAGQTIGPVISPSGRLKARFILAGKAPKEKIQRVLGDVMNALENAVPLSPITLRILLGMVESSIEQNTHIEPIIFSNIADSILILPIMILKQHVFNVMCTHVLDENSGAKEIAFVSDKLNGHSNLLNLLQSVKKKGLSELNLLRSLESLRKEDAIRYDMRDEPFMR